MELLSSYVVDPFRVRCSFPLLVGFRALWNSCVLCCESIFPRFRGFRVLWKFCVLMCESIFSIFLMHSEFIVVFAKEIWHASCEVVVAENDFVCSFPKGVMD